MGKSNKYVRMRLFDGKRYFSSPEEGEGTKKQIMKARDSAKKYGYSVRVVKTGSKYRLWTRYPVKR